MILLISMCYHKLSEDEFVRPVAKIIQSEYEIKHYTEIKTVPAGYEKIIICGTSFMDNDYIKNIQMFDWLKKTDIPVLGICSGMQAIALIYGSEMIRSEEIGMTGIFTKMENPLFSGSFDAYCIHGNAILPSDAFEITATSGKCIQGIKLKGKKVFGVMFHPEARNMDIILNFLALN